MATGESAVGESDFYEAFDAGKPLSDDEDIVSDVSVLLGAEDKGFFSRVSKVVKSAAKKVAKKGAKAKKFVKATMKKALKGLLNKGKGGKKHIGGAYEKLTRAAFFGAAFFAAFFGAAFFASVFFAAGFGLSA